MKKCKASGTAGILSSRYYSLLMRIFHYFSLIKRDRKSLGGTAKIIGQNQPREEWMKHVKIKYTITFIREKRPLKCCYSLSGGARRALLQDIVCLVFHRILCLKDKTQWMEDIRQTPTNGVQQGSYPVLYNDTDPVRIQFSRQSISNNPNDERRLDETGMRDRTLSPWSPTPPRGPHSPGKFWTLKFCSDRIHLSALLRFPTRWRDQLGQGLYGETNI